MLRVALVAAVLWASAGALWLRDERVLQDTYGARNELAEPCGN